jgi:phosphoadenosine phosphosulfate reductase
MLDSADLSILNERLAARPTEEVLRWAWEQFGERAAIGTSFQGAGLVLMHLSKVYGFGFPLFTIDTGLLFPETVALKSRLEGFLGRAIETLEPDLTVEQQALAHGPELWRREPDLCCTLRKVLPLRDRLVRLDAWITGLRRDQSDTRAGVQIVEHYELEGAAGLEPATARTIVKLNPMAAWKREAVWEYVRRHGIPYNPLHDQGYRSIGCQPCTAKTGAAHSERAGRWSGFGKTECGIHTFLKRPPEPAPGAGGAP